ncbi:MAG TPA: ABC transporter ATP-binding protein, partial [Deinococcales bacterium]|nr:ABC transporter ATP-binding protein [Deinococcales bacterium]
PAGGIPGPALALIALGGLASFEAVTGLGQAYATLETATAAAARLDEATTGEPAAPPPARPVPLPEDRTLRFEDVSFAFPGEPEDAPDTLRGVNFSLEPGRKVAVIGPSGAGKSVLVNLGARLFDPTSGRVTLGGVALRDLADADLRGAVTVVSQDAHAFDSTVRENLRFARPDASEDDLWRALRAARLEGVVQALPHGLDSWVGEAGARISGGERQRLAIARAALRRPSILILDEPTANLDSATEAEVLAALDELSAGSSLLMVTHRLTRLERFDEVLVLDQGRIVERGPAAALLARNGLLSRLARAQAAQLPG